MLEFLDHIDIEALLVVGKAVSAAVIAMIALVVIFGRGVDEGYDFDELTLPNSTTISGPPSTTQTLETPKWAQTISFDKSDMGEIQEAAKRAGILHRKVYEALLTGEPKVEVDGLGSKDRFTLKPTNIVETFNAAFKLPPSCRSWSTPRVTEDLGSKQPTAEARDALISFANKNPDPDAYPGGRLAFDHHARRLTNDHMAEIAETEGRAQAHLLSARSRLSSIRDNVDDLKQFVLDCGKGGAK